MTDRNTFALSAMTALMSKFAPYECDTSPRNNPGRFPGGREDVPDVDQIAKYAYAMADAMLKARR